MRSRKKSAFKESGGRYKDNRKKKKIDLARLPALTKVGAKRSKDFRKRGGSHKQRLLSADTANVYDPSTKKYSKTKVLSVKENPANRHYVRRNIMTKGTVIETELGKAKITSRPGQEGTVNAILLK